MVAEPLLISRASLLIAKSSDAIRLSTKQRTEIHLRKIAIELWIMGSLPVGD